MYKYSLKATIEVILLLKVGPANLTFISGKVRTLNEFPVGKAMYCLLSIEYKVGDSAEMNFPISL